MSTLNAWDVTDANNNATPPDGWPENTMQYSEVNDTGRAVQGTLKRFFADTNGSLQAAGVADAYTLTLNETGYSAYFAGMWFACEIPANNTGTSTIDVNGIGAQLITDRAGNVLTAGELQSGGIYEFRYDGTNFQLMGTVAGQISTPSAILTNSAAPDLVDTNVALNVGASDPDSAQHIEVGPEDIQSKSNATTAATLDINALGGNVRLGAQSGTGQVNQYFAGALRALTAADAFQIRDDANADPTVPDNIDVELQFRSQDGNEYGGVGYNNTTLRLFNRAHGGLVQLNGEDSSGNARTGFDMNPDGVVNLRHPGDNVLRMQMAAGGIVNLRSNDNVDTSVRRLDFEHQDGTLRAFVGQNGTTDLRVDNRINGANLILAATTAGGSTVDLMTADPDLQAVRVTRDLKDQFRIGTSLSTASMPLGASVNPNGNALAIGDAGGDQIGYMAYVADGVRNPRAFFGVHDNDVWGISGTASSGSIPFIIEWAGTSLIEATPSDDVALFDNGTEVARTLPAASGGFQVNNTLTGGGFERVLTTSDSGGGGNVSNTGTPLNNQIAIWTNATTIEGDPNVTYDGTAFRILESTASQAALLRIEHSAAADGVQIAQRDNTFDDIELNRTNGAGVEGNTLIEWSIGDGTDLYDSGNLVARTKPTVSGGFEVDGFTIGGGFAEVIVDQDETVIYGRQPNGGFVADGIGFSTLSISGANADTYSGKCLQFSSGDTLRFASLSGWSGDEAGGTLRLGSGTMTIGASNISVDFWEAQASGITYHNLSGTSTFSVTGPGIGAWRYAGDAQAIGFVFAA